MWPNPSLTWILLLPQVVIHLKPTEGLTAFGVHVVSWRFPFPSYQQDAMPTANRSCEGT